MTRFNAQAAVATATKGWAAVAPILTAPTNDEELQHLINVMNQLVDMGATEQTHPLAGMLYMVGLLIELYEKEHDSIVER